MSLLEQLPTIIANGRQQALRILESLDGHRRAHLLTREYVLPDRYTDTTDGGFAPLRHAPQPNDASPSGWTNRLIRGDDLLTIAALLAGNEGLPSLRGCIDLIWIARPLTPRTHYRTSRAGTDGGKPTRPTKRGTPAGQRRSDVEACLAAIVPRLMLMRELLAETGSIQVEFGPQLGHYATLVLDQIFGKDNFVQEWIWTPGAPAGEPARSGPHRCIVHYAKACALRHADPLHPPYDPADVHDEEAYGRGVLDEERLRECSIVHACPADGVVADFSGAGIAASVAERLGRRWIATGPDTSACVAIQKQLINQKARPYLHQSVRAPRSEPAASCIGSDLLVDPLIETVLSAFGATPLPREEDPVGNLGTTAIDGRQTLVRVDSPDKPTGEASLRKTLSQFPGGWERVVLLGWRFAPSLSASLAALRHPHLDVLEIQPVQTGHFPAKGDFARSCGTLQFSSLRHLALKRIRRVRPRLVSQQRDQARYQETLEVVLDTYMVFSPDTLGLDPDGHSALTKTLATDPLALIEYWAVDPDYDEAVFRSVWQDYRGNTAPGRDPSRVTAVARFKVPYKRESRRVCVRVVDVFGAETDVVQVLSGHQRPAG